MKKTEILGIMFDYVDFKEARERVFSFLEQTSPKTVFTPNPEMVMAARKNPAFKRVLNSGDIVIPDGIGIVYASKLNKNKLTERVAGYDLVREILQRAARTGKTAFFLGGAPGVAEAAKSRAERAFDGLRVVGCRDGYFREDADVLAAIADAKPDILLVGLGFPKQETWIDRNKTAVGASVLVACGGTLDALAGNVKRAPKIFIKLGLEWLYRLIKQPSRIKRQLAIPMFIFVVLKEKIKYVFSGKTVSD